MLQEVKNLLNVNRLKGRRCSFLCGDAGPLSLAIIVNHKLGLKEETDNLVEKLRALNKDVVDIQSDLPNECLYGRAGYLYSILYVNKYVSPPPFNENFISEVRAKNTNNLVYNSLNLLLQIIEAILVSGQNLAKAGQFKCPLMYEWHDSYYLGAAHGLSGILYILLQAREYLTEKDLNSLIKPTIEYLAAQR